MSERHLGFPALNFRPFLFVGITKSMVLLKAKNLLNELGYNTDMCTKWKDIFCYVCFHAKPK
jgi:hypothetical protein